MAKLNSIRSVQCVGQRRVAVLHGYRVAARGSWQARRPIPGLAISRYGPSTRYARGLRFASDDYRDARRERAGRSEISPNAGGTATARCPGNADGHRC